MKKSVITLTILLSITTIYSCKQNKKQDEKEPQTTTSQPAPETPSVTSSTEPKTYKVTAMPDTVSLGKNKEAFIKIKNMKAIELSNPDGQVTGMELTYQIELTNRTALGGSAVGVPTTDFRLELDNGNKISSSTVFVSAEPESTKLSDVDKFEIPAGAKPTVLNLFFDQTRASVKLELK